MVQRTAKVPHEYAGRQVEVGERFEVEPAHVELMLGMGRIEREEGDCAPAFVHPTRSADWPNSYNTRAMTAARSGRQRIMRKGASA